MKWIPIEKDVPSYSGDFIATVDEKGWGKGIEVVSYITDGGHWLDFNGYRLPQDAKVIAWTPFPKPYGGGEDE